MTTTDLITAEIKRTGKSTLVRQQHAAAHFIGPTRLSGGSI